MPTPQQTETHREDGIEWLRGRSYLAALGVTLLGFLVRVWAAHGTFLNPDEALHFRLANQLSLAQAYKESLTASHPPLLTSLLYFWRALGTSELWLRFPSVLAGTVFCWMLYKWLSNTAGPLAGLIALLLAALLPPVVLISAEIRQYALLLAFLASALCFLDKAFARKSAGEMAAFSLFLYLAMLSHYSAFLFAAALGVYALQKFFTERPPGLVAAVWAAGQVGAWALAAFLYKTHLAKLGAGESRTVLQGWMSEFYLYRSYFDSERDNPFLFVIGHSFGVFQFVFGQLAVGDVAALLFLAALFFLVRGTALPKSASVRASRQLALLLVLTFAFVCGASLAHFYPYGGTRHSAILVMPAVAGVSIGIARLTGQRWAAVVITGFILALCVVFGKQHQPYMQRSDQGRVHMNEAMDFLHQNARAPEIVFTDYESDLILGHYLCGQKPVTLESSIPDFEEFSCDGVRVVSASYRAATSFDASKFLDLWARLAETYHLNPGDTVWVFEAGWRVNFPDDLRSHFADFHDLHFESFGNNIKIFKLTVGEPMPSVAR